LFCFVSLFSPSQGFHLSVTYREAVFSYVTTLLAPIGYSKHSHIQCGSPDIHLFVNSVTSSCIDEGAMLCLKLYLLGQLFCCHGTSSTCLLSWMHVFSLTSSITNFNSTENELVPANICGEIPVHLLTYPYCLSLQISARLLWLVKNDQQSAATI